MFMQVQNQRDEMSSMRGGTRNISNMQEVQGADGIVLLPYLQAA